MSESTDAERRLIDAAWGAREGARCPHSGFAVGAAALDEDGRIWTGANVENDSYTLGLCAERVALFHALTHGASDFVRVVIATDTDAPTPPCGACRQILWEFAPAAEVVMVTRSGPALRLPVRELMPHGFDLG